jgi:endo-1,4-beta-xylanase
MKKHVVSALIACALSVATAYSQDTGGAAPAPIIGPKDAQPLISSGSPAPAPTIGLKDAFAGKFLIGTAGDVPRGYSEAELANIKANYNIITPENCMKPMPTHPAEETYNWTAPDAMVQWCASNNIKVWGHTLAWHAQTAGWFFQGTNGEPVTRELAMERLKKHIMTEVGRYKGRVYGWDVVNEAINDNGNGQTENLRNDSWVRVIGPDFLTMAFKWAHEADPDALLFYNDYNIDQDTNYDRPTPQLTGKHSSSMLLLKRLIKDGAPINGVGIQGHWHLYNNIPDVEKAIADYESLGLKVGISELDVTATGSNSGAFPGGGGGGGTVTAEALQQQAEVYAKLFDIFNRHAKSISRVTFWGISDRRSWRSNQRPLVFDAQLQPKPALQAIIDVGLGKNVTK